MKWLEAEVGWGDTCLQRNKQEQVPGGGGGRPRMEGILQTAQVPEDEYR